MRHSLMTDWKLYQDETAKLFRELGCTVETDFEIAGARGKRSVDVYVVFSKFGLRQHWIVECEFLEARRAEGESSRSQGDR